MDSFNISIGGRARELVGLRFIGFAVMLICVLQSNVEAQTGGWRPLMSSNVLRRSQSDPRLNRNTSSIHRQSSFRGNCKTNYRFDYVQLTLQWAPGVCSTSPHECKLEENRHFTVHGMWPTIKGTEEPGYCCFDNSFDYRALNQILPTLNEYWFSYFDSGSRGFWSHEWLKHGTCARDIPALRGEQRYFGTTVQMAKQMPILEALAKANIVPDNKKAYESSDIYKALMVLSQGKNIQIDCDYEHNQPIPVLTGLNFCFDGELKPSDCPEMRRKCQKQLYFRASATRLSPRRPSRDW